MSVALQLGLARSWLLTFVYYRLRIIILTNIRPEADWEGRDCHGEGGRAIQRTLLVLTPGYLLSASMIFPADISPKVFLLQSISGFTCGRSVSFLHGVLKFLIPC